jgi:hypothetical protein
VKNVRRFSVDGLKQAKGVEFLSNLKKLESLTVEIYDLDSFDFLSDLPSGIKQIILGKTKSKKPDLKPLGRFRSLEQLHLEGQQKNIEVLSELKELRELTLRSVSTAGLEFLRPLKRLWSLDIKLGGIANLAALQGIENIKYLELWQVTGLSDLTPISHLYGLQYLFLQSLRNVKVMPSLSRLRFLRRIYLEAMKGLMDLQPVAEAPALEDLKVYSMHQLEPEDFRPFVGHRTLRCANINLGGERRSSAAAELLALPRVEEDFVYT